MRHDNTAKVAGAVLAALLNHSPDALVEIVFQRGDRLLADLDLGAVRYAKDVVDELGHGVAAQPEELRLTIVNEVEAIGDNVGRGQIYWRREGDIPCRFVWEASIVGHVVKRIESRVYVLYQKGKG